MYDGDDDTKVGCRVIEFKVMYIIQVCRVMYIPQ